MEDLNPQVVRGFGRKLKSYNKLRGMYVCNTDKGIKQVKKLEIKKEIIMFEYMVKELLYNKGFKNIDRSCVALDGMPYYILNDALYVMSDYIEGVECELNKNLDSAVEQLATMHKFASGLELSKCNEPLNLINLYKKRTVEMGRLKKRITSISNLTNLDLLILKNYDEYYNQCIKSIEMLENSDYKHVLQLAKQKGDFCHNNYREENIIINIKGVYIKNFESSCCDTHLIDLVNIIRRYMKKNYCDEQEAYRILETYNKIKPINKEDIKIILAMLTFPYKFLKVCNIYYNKRRSWVQNGITYSLELYLDNKQKNLKLIELIEKNM